MDGQLAFPMYTEQVNALTVSYHLLSDDSWGHTKLYRNIIVNLIGILI